jgi:hypothetical protein
MKRQRGCHLGFLKATLGAADDEPVKFINPLDQYLDGFSTPLAIVAFAHRVVGLLDLS